MGTDIHLYVERFNGERWEEIEPPYETPYGDKTWNPYYENYRSDHGNPDPMRRNYLAFAFLADVRNRYGFANIPTHKRIKPMFPERGFPHDTSWEEPQYKNSKRISGPTWLGDHSYTWATLTELLNAPWDIEFQSVGVVNKDGFSSFKERGYPLSWMGDIVGGGARIWSQETYEVILANGEVTENDFTRISWSWRPLEDCHFRRWLTEVLAPMAEGDTDGIRVLMGFDS